MFKLPNHLNWRAYALYFMAPILAVLLDSCGDSQVDRTMAVQQDPALDVLERTNVLLIETESQEIEDFIDRYGWQMSETGTGLRYQIYRSGEGESVTTGQLAMLDYQVFLLNGEMIYSSQEEGIKQFRIGQGGVESGLEEGILLLRQGDKARFIIPSHLAHGVPGDGIRIPQLATIIYDLEVLELF